MDIIKIKRSDDNGMDGHEATSVELVHPDGARTPRIDTEIGEAFAWVRQGRDAYGEDPDEQYPVVTKVVIHYFDGTQDDYRRIEP
jgi:hypothetical protein